MPIRLATPADAAGIAAVIHAMTELRSVAGLPLERTTAIVADNLQRLAASGTSSAYVALEGDGAIAGYAAVHWVPFLFLAGGEAYVTELFVRPADSGRGLGSQLLAEITAAARTRGCARVSLLNGRDSASYHRAFYKQHGWTERDRMANFILPLPVPAAT